MSYLDFPSFTVAGNFYTDPSTMDNDPSHYDESCTNPSPWQDPGGSHFFSFQDILASQIPNRAFKAPVVASALDQFGNASFTDPLVGCPMSSMDSPGGLGGTAPFSPAKMIDLDVYQQGVSMIYGFFPCLTVGTTRLVGAMDACSLNSVWFSRVLPTRGWQSWDDYGWGSFGGDTNASGVYQSIVRIPAASWPAASGSAILDQLRAATTTDASGNLLLSVRMVLDGYQNVAWHQSDFRIGRVVATFGPVFSGDPTECIAGRWLAGRPAGSGDPWNQPYLYGAPSQLKQGPASGPYTGQYLAIDLANAFATASPGGEPVDLGNLTLYLGDGSLGPVGAPFQLNDVFYSAGGGIARLPLTAAQADAAITQPFTLVSSRTDLAGMNGATMNGQPVLWQEAANGLWLACDGRNFQLASDVGQRNTATANIYLTQFGLPVAVSFDLQVAVYPCYQGNGAATVPWSGGYAGDSPSAEGALQAELVIQAADAAQLILTAVADPGSRTPELDCQLYFLCFTAQGLQPLQPNLPAPPPQEQMISCVVWASYPVNTNPAFAEIQSIMKVYDKLFPSMHAKIDLLDEQTFFTFALNPPWPPYYGGLPGPEQVSLPNGGTIAAGAIPYYLTRTIDDPRFMPIMRNLSPNKLLTVLYYCWNLQQQVQPTPAPPGEPGGEV